MMLRTRSNALGALAGCILLITNHWGAYERYWWFDNAAHFLGGVTVGGFVATEDSSRLMDLSLTLGVATVWEGFEAWMNVSPWDGSHDYDDAVEDTILDTVLVLAGALLASEATKQHPHND